MRVFALHVVLRVQEYVLSVLLGEHVDASAVGGHPDIAFLVFNGKVGSVVAQAVLVVIVMEETLQGVASALADGHLEQSVVLGAEPVVAF